VVTSACEARPADHHRIERPSQEIQLTRFEVDAQAILDAAARAQVVFSEPEGGGPAFIGYGG
jgi:hypothetical protein